MRKALKVKQVSYRAKSLKLEIEGETYSVVSGYVPHVGRALEDKEKFWSDLDDVIQSIPRGDGVMNSAYFNGHAGEGV